MLRRTGTKGGEYLHLGKRKDLSGTPNKDKIRLTPLSLVRDRMERLLALEDALSYDPQRMNPPDGSNANSKANRNSCALQEDVKQLSGF